MRRELLLVWVPLAAVAVAILVTYSRLAPADLYHVSGSGFDAGLGRVLVFLSFPTALAAIAVLALVAERLGGRAIALAAVAGVALCAAVFVPGVVDQADLDAKWSNVPCALGVAIAVALVLFAAGWLPHDAIGRLAADPVRIAVAAAAFALSIPWIAAEVGFSFDAARVHHGHHHGMDGFLLVLTALLLSRVLPSVRRTWLRAVTGAYLALMLVYGLGEIANDFWLEQIVKRGWTDWEIPDITRPSASAAWGIVVLASLVVFGVGAWRTGQYEAASANPPAPAT